MQSSNYHNMESLVVAGFSIVAHVDHFVALGGCFVVGFIRR